MARVYQGFTKVLPGGFAPSSRRSRPQVCQGGLQRHRPTAGAREGITQQGRHSVSPAGPRAKAAQSRHRVFTQYAGFSADFKTAARPYWSFFMCNLRTDKRRAVSGHAVLQTGARMPVQPGVPRAGHHPTACASCACDQFTCSLTTGSGCAAHSASALCMASRCATVPGWCAALPMASATLRSQRA